MLSQSERFELNDALFIIFMSNKENKKVNYVILKSFLQTSDEVMSIARMMILISKLTNKPLNGVLIY